MTIIAETWKPIKGYPEYLISDMGRVKSAKFNKARILKSHKTNGYPRVRLTLNGVQKDFSVHRLLLTAFRRDPLPDEQGSHLNGIRHDNRLENLQWESKVANNARRIEHGTLACGEKHGAAKLTADQVIAIRAEYVPRVVTQEFLSKKYGIHRSMIGYIVNGKKWRRLAQTQAA